MLNKVIMMGRLCDDPDSRQTQIQIPVCRFRIAINRPKTKDGQDKADFINCVAFGKQAEFAEKYLRKGMKIGVTGRIQTGSYTARDGSKHYTTDVVVDTQEFMTSKAENATESVTEHTDKFEAADDMELPFI